MSPGPAPSHRAPRARLLVVILFAVAMGWLEGVVVVYIRAMLGIAHGPLVPEPAALAERFSGFSWFVLTEQGREAATVVMLACVAWLAAGRWSARFGAFLVAFGVWDIVYYVALWAHLRWPPSLATRDVLFLIPPGPWWYQPVWVPVAISAAWIALGAWLMLRGPRRG